MVSSISQQWLPELFEVNVSEDLVPQLHRKRDAVLQRIAAIRNAHGVSQPIVRIRDGCYLAARTYTVSIQGIVVAWGSVRRIADLEDELVRVIGEVWQSHGDALRQLVQWRASIAADAAKQPAGSS